MLKVDNLNQYYGGSHILRGLSFDVPVGKVTVLCEGSVLAEGDLATVQADPRVIEVYLGR